MNTAERDLLNEAFKMLISIDLLRLDWTDEKLLGEPLDIRNLAKRIQKELEDESTTDAR